MEQCILKGNQQPKKLNKTVLSNRTAKKYFDRIFIAKMFAYLIPDDGNKRSFKQDGELSKTAGAESVT